MTDTDRGSGGSDRQLEFLQEAFGLSEAEAKEVLEEYEGLQNRSEPTREVVISTRGGSDGSSTHYGTRESGPKTSYMKTKLWMTRS